MKATIDAARYGELKMQYMMIIYAADGSGPAPESAEMGELMQAYGAFGAEAREKGVMVAGDALQPVSTSTTVRVRNGVTETTDGPFAETKEQLGGYYILDCKNLDEAIEYAAKIPTAKYGSVEIRPVMVFDKKDFD
jgi:hypothetical protein